MAIHNTKNELFINPFELVWWCWLETLTSS